MPRKYNLLTGKIVKAQPLNSHAVFKNLIGETFGHLKIVAYAGRKRSKKSQPCTSIQSKWVGLCDCGSYNLYTTGNLRGGISTHCQECAHKYKKPGKSGGQSKTLFYYRWAGLKFRYPNELCKRWKNSYLNFAADVGHPPENKVLARIDESRKYGPENFQWITFQELQARRAGIWYTFNKKSGCISDWARWLGISRERVRQRLKRYPPEIALSKNFKSKAEKWRNKNQ